MIGTSVLLLFMPSHEPPNTRWCMNCKRGRKCCHCKTLFRADARNRGRQRYCSGEACRAASKAAGQRSWLSKPENRDYFRGPLNTGRVQEWRARTPRYWKRGGPATAPALQDVSTTQAVEITAGSGTLALQDIITNQPLVILGLIASLTGTTLQEDIELSSRNLIRLGQDVIGKRGGANGDEAAYLPGTGTTHTEAV